MLPQEIIRAKRDKQILSAEQIKAFVRGITDGSVSEGQIAAFGMAVYFNGMTRDEAVALTTAMQYSGDVLEWRDLDGPVVDKHSTGGVGDNVSLMLAPIVAACGAFVPMISGRGLGHTGGTLDKMDAILGYQSYPDKALFDKVVRDCGCAIIGPTGDLAPADKRFYAVRDVTATVESIPLITASILSKKLASGIGGLVLDVKTGSGAFMPTFEASQALAQSLVQVANGAGLPTSALITDMNEPLADCAGNAVEVRNAVDFLTGAKRQERLAEVVLNFAAHMLVTAGLAQTVADGLAKAQTALDNGSAAEKFGRMVSGLGGPADFVERAAHYLPVAPIQVPVCAERDGYISAIDTRAVGMSVVALGGGRMRPQDQIDPSVGVTNILPLGSEVKASDVLALVHAQTQDKADQAVQMVRQAMMLSDSEPQLNPVIYETVTA
ncbi:thymidine phosphorylase [Pseudochrobactrum algeriensis]|uniref:thymidine phosphorylase n=1 Tax=Pseudochrobactrum algeriensis TaxID=2834768 RepID=UPI001BCE3526|nr:thymidine phosphorylase [Pseudochrobactrum algeriensis]MBX8812830.1 thymidine phosphorylase [Ochrobactrum sp. MR34]QVQ36261.1 thymidine phosphorylase [Pseudochrobactrum algeriensis]QVQ39478.1 thymidine phosphorylase [Pseudochrobactrum algeriensis]QVQ43398.1 thymidine phosphorylase [Pseudochrobactrum algeriensis]